MKVIIVPLSEVGAKVAADRVERLLHFKRNPVLGLATGSSPLPLYQELITRELDWQAVTTFNLDEYYPISPGHRQSYRFFMDQNLFDHVNIRRENTFVPQGNLTKQKIRKYCDWYESMINEFRGIDLQIIGIGRNGHIAFNEPGSAFYSRTRLIELDESTRQANCRFFDGDLSKVPTHAITMGIGTIVEARSIILLAWGKDKASAVSHSVEGPVTIEVPASVLQLHPNATWIIDEEAASSLKNHQLYTYVKEEY